MEEDSQKTKEEFVVNLNKQIETHQSVINEKDNKIINQKIVLELVNRPLWIIIIKKLKLVIN
jgi:hypothetical protein